MARVVLTTVSISSDVPVTGKTVANYKNNTIMATKKIEISYNKEKVDSNSLSASPWTDGAEFVLAGVMSAKIKGTDGKWSDPRAVFLTDLGCLWPTMVRKARIDIDGEIHRPTKAFVQLWSDIQEAVKTSDCDWDALEKIVLQYKNKAFRVVRDEFPAKTSDGRTYVGAVVDAELFGLTEADYKARVEKAEKLAETLG